MNNARSLAAAALVGAALTAAVAAPALATGGHTTTKVTICHVPKHGDPSTETVSVAALLGHKHHPADYLGPCKPKPTPTLTPTPEPTTEPTTVPTPEPSSEPTTEPTVEPSTEPTEVPSTEPSSEPTTEPTTAPTTLPSTEPTVEPTAPLEPLIPITDTPLTPDTEIGTAIQLERRLLAVQDSAEPASPASTQHLASTGGAERGYLAGAVVLIAVGGIALAARRWTR